MEITEKDFALGIRIPVAQILKTFFYQAFDCGNGAALMPRITDF